ncbi:hypothetical protein IMW82_14125 [Rhodanobacter sp. B2A1Ga4]|uniref:hypothetical protein n=1 Tax=Rhodanobacter sp. B2A1Ga4 TaxID=2778647 RepID=UPI001B358CB6|nr:hypothetical protein [Rhodanobacter sp. B2A1Ga4]MBQ4855809.1 hypothetical protein [Rhodanobacter sp. B2A1Ga4]
MNRHIAALTKIQRLIGGDLAQVPYISSFGRAYRLSRLNGLWLTQLPEVLKTTSTIQAGLRGGIVPWKEMDGWEASLWGREHDLLPHHWEDWHPFSDKSEAHADLLRGCRQCLAYGFHTMLHQLPWIATCPWHGDGLVKNCTCGRSLLPHKGRSADFRLLHCPCGIDHYQRNKALLGMHQWPKDQVTRAIHEYLHSTGRTRKTTRLLPAGRLYKREDYRFVSQNAFPRGSDELCASSPFARSGFDEHSIGHATSNEEVGAILRTWWQPTFLRPGLPCPVLKEHCDQVVAYGLDARRQLDALNFSATTIEVSSANISVLGFPILTIDPDRVPAAAVNASIASAKSVGRQLLLAVYASPEATTGADWLTPMDELTLWAMQSRSAKVLAHALSYLTSLCAIDNIRTTVEYIRSGREEPHFALILGQPIALVSFDPTLHIRIGYQLPVTTTQGTTYDSL